MKNRLLKRICAIIISACICISLVSIIGIADAKIITVDTAKGTGNFITNGGFEADSKLKNINGNITVGWNLTGGKAELSDDFQEGESALKITTIANSIFTLIPDITNENGNISGMDSGIYTFSCYLKGDTQLLFKSWDSNGSLATDIFNEKSENITEWQKFSSSFSVSKGGTARFQICSSEVTEEKNIYIDNVSLVMNTAVINGDFEGDTKLPEVDENIIVNGDFELGYVTTKQIGGFTEKGDETTKIFCAEDGSVLKKNYYFNTFTSQGIKAEFSYESDFVYSGKRSLKITNILKENLNNRFNIIPECATEQKVISGQRVYFIKDLEKGSYIFEAYVKTPTANTPVILYEYNWSKNTTSEAANTKNMVADKNGWYLIRHKFIVGSDGYLGFALNCVLGNSQTKEVYIDKISLKKREENNDNFIANGGFEKGEYITSQIGGYPAKGDVNSKVFSGKDDITLGVDYYFNTFTSQAVKGEIITENDFVYSGARSLKLSNIIGNYNSRFNMVPETATVAKKISSQTVLFTPGVAPGNYGVQVRVKINSADNTAPVILYTYSWKDASRTIAATTKNSVPDKNGWYLLEADAKVLDDGYLGFSLSCEFGSYKPMDVYIDNFFLKETNSESTENETLLETDIPYLKTNSPDGGKDVLSVVADDSISGKYALKVSQKSGENISIHPDILHYSLKRGYNMLAFWAKGDGKIDVRIKTSSDEVYKTFALYDEWHKYTIRDIEVKSGEKIEDIALRIFGEEAMIDAIQLYSQSGPAKMTENLELKKGDKFLCLPAVLDGYRVKIKSVSDSSIIDLNGKITTPKYDSSVKVVLNVENVNDKTDNADSHVFTLSIPGKLGQIPKEKYKFMTLKDKESGVSVSGVFAPDVKFRAMEIGEDNPYYEDLLNDKKCLGFYNAVITPIGGYSSTLEFKIPVDKNYNEKLIEAVYKDDNDELTLYSVRVKNGYVTLEAPADGFIMLMVEKPVVSEDDNESDSSNSSSNPESESQDSSGSDNEDNTSEDDNSDSSDNTSTNDINNSSDKSESDNSSSDTSKDDSTQDDSSSEDNEEPEKEYDSDDEDSEKDNSKDESVKDPTTSTEKANKKLSIRKLIDTTWVWNVIIIALAVILIIIEVTVTLIIRKKIRR